jgi:zinc finger protein
VPVSFKASSSAPLSHSHVCLETWNEGILTPFRPTYLSLLIERGSIYTAHIRSRADFDRQIVKSPTCTITIPEFALTIPPNRGQLTNVEGIVRDTMRDLDLDQPLRKVIEPENFEKIGALVARLKAVLGDEDKAEGEMSWEGEGRLGGDGPDAEVKEGRPEREDVKRQKMDEPFPIDSKPTLSSSKAAEVEKPFVPFTITLDDPAGNSFLQFIDSISDPKWTLRTYVRSREQDESLGMMAASGPGSREPVDGERSTADGEEEGEDAGEGHFANEEVYSFPSICSSCGGALDTMMKKVNIPYFQVRLISSFLLSLSLGSIGRSFLTGFRWSSADRLLALPFRQDIIIMSTNCQSCGYKDNEVKSGGAVSEKGKKIVLKVDDPEDLSRDLLKVSPLSS